MTSWADWLYKEIHMAEDQVVEVDIIKECYAKKPLQNNYGENEKKLPPGTFVFFKHKL